MDSVVSPRTGLLAIDRLLMMAACALPLCRWCQGRGIFATSDGRRVVSCDCTALDED